MGDPGRACLILLHCLIREQKGAERREEKGMRREKELARNATHSAWDL
jgi:hypothetical protein